MKGFFKFLLRLLRNNKFKVLLVMLAKEVVRLSRNNKCKLAAKAARAMFRLGYKKGHWQGKHKGKQLGIEQGIKQGKQLGIEEYKRDIVKHMLARGMPDDQICDLLQLSKRELAAIKRKLKKLG